MTEKKRTYMRLLNLGCGLDHRTGYINVDINPEVNPDIVHDLNNIPYPFKNSSVERIECHQVLEHLIIHPIEFFIECGRILKNDGVIRFSLPNNFFWRNRIKFLFGTFEKQSGWCPFHTKLVKPTTIIDELIHLGYGVKVNDSGLRFLPLNLRLFNIKIQARKRR